MARFKNLGDLIRRDRDLTKVAIIDLGGEEVPTEYTYFELDAMTVGVARALAKRGLKRGDRIAILSQNRAEYIAARALWMVAPAPQPPVPGTTTRHTTPTNRPPVLNCVNTEGDWSLGL